MGVASTQVSAFTSGDVGDAYKKQDLTEVSGDKLNKSNEEILKNYKWEFPFDKVGLTLACHQYCSKEISRLIMDGKLNPIKKKKVAGFGGMSLPQSLCYKACVCMPGNIKLKRINPFVRDMCKKRAKEVGKTAGPSGDKFIWWNPLTWF